MSALACPLRSTARVLDILYVVLPPEYGNAEWLALATLACKQHQQVESAWVARRQAQQQAVIAGEIERASHLQMSLIPKDSQIKGMDLAVGFEPCRWVGGDYVDVVQTPGGKTFLVVADVSGKGLQAALVAASLHTMVHATLRAGMDLSGLFTNMNQYLCETLPEQSFVTVVGVMLDSETGEIECMNCGHPPAMVINRAGQLRRLQSAANLPLGVDPDIELEVQRDRVDPGELLFMYTDGVTEMVDETGKMLGINRLGDYLCSIYLRSGVVPVRDMANQINNILNRILGRQMAGDDRTFLLGRRMELLPVAEVASGAGSAVGADVGVAAAVQ